MTYIEFYDQDAVKNILSCLSSKPDKVILVGNKTKQLKKQAEIYRDFFMNRWMDIDFQCIKINKDDLTDCIKKLGEIIENNDDCHFDITGGDELSLVALGCVFERYKDIKQVQIHRFNVNNGKLQDCDQDGNIIDNFKEPMLKIEEMIALKGGRIIYEEESSFGTPEWTTDEDFINDVKVMWKICKEDVRLWNVQIGVLNAIEVHRDQRKDSLLTISPSVYVSDYLKRQGFSLFFDFSLMKSLVNGGLIENYSIDDTSITIRYKNEQIKKCLTKAGNILEMIIYISAYELKDEKGKRLFNDVMNGVYIDWDGIIEDEDSAIETRNEIDVIMMKGIIPVFVSCKNGQIDTEELYKFNSVAEHFGGKKAKKVLVATALGNDGHSDSIRKRAADMKIKLIEGLQYMSEEAIAKKVKNICNG